jgi:long-chain acyl-CoA synthetase
VNLIGDYRAGGSIGAILPCTEVKLVDIPDMKYMSTDLPFPRGEIVIRGPNIMSGYHKDLQKTAETIDANGWLSTGDVGTIVHTF